MKNPEKESQRCQAGRDGECFWKDCPQEKDGRTNYQGEGCPLRVEIEDAD